VLGEALGDELGETLGEALAEELGEALGEALGVALGEVLGDKLGDALGEVLGEALGKVLGDEALGEALGAAKFTVPPLSKYTLVCAMRQPFIIAFVPTVMADPAIMEPSNTLSAPMVAALPRAQRTFFALAPFSRTKDVCAPVVRVL
jgi:hypothetical protein